MNRFAVIASISVLALSACRVVGPKYHTPASPSSATFKEAPPADWKQAQPQDAKLKEKWWEIFADPDLNALEEQVDVSNQNIATAEAQFREARAAVKVARADLFPTLSVSPAATVSHSPSHTGTTTPNGGVTSGGGTGTTYELPFDLSYEVDLWGRVRSQVEAAATTAQASAADLETMRLSMHSELAMDYFELHGTDEQKELYDTSVASYVQALTLTKNRYDQGIVSGVDVAQAQTQLDTTRAGALDLEVQRTAYEHAIAVLTGKAPSELTIAEAPIHAQPPVIPVGVPSELLERRPDVSGAERRVASANAQIGVAKAAFYPTLTLSATAGFTSTAISQLLSLPSRFWSIGPAFAETLFDAGKRRGTVQESEAAYDATVATYRQAVLQAFQDVEDNLAALRVLENEAAQQDIATKSAEHTLELTTNQYRGGITTYLSVITAQNTALDNERTEVALKIRRMTASVLLVKALGGGWDKSKLPTVGR